MATIRKPISHYQAEMRRRGSEVAAISIESMKQLHSPNSVDWMD